MTDFCIYNQCFRVWKTQTCNHQKGWASMSLSIKNWSSTWILLEKQYKGMNDNSSLQWIHNWNSKSHCERHYILLLQDNFSAHISSDDFTNIHVGNFSLNLTAHIQPADADIIYCFKFHYCACFVNCAIDCYNSDISSAKIYNLNIFKAL